MESLNMPFMERISGDFLPVGYRIAKQWSKCSHAHYALLPMAKICISMRLDRCPFSHDCATEYGLG